MSIALGTALGMVAVVYPPAADSGELVNRIPEAAPYVTAEAAFVAPPFEEYWQTNDHPEHCQNCHSTIFDEWDRPMMGRAGRDRAWRATFLLPARELST